MVRVEIWERVGRSDVVLSLSSRAQEASGGLDGTRTLLVTGECRRGIMYVREVSGNLGNLKID